MSGSDWARQDAARSRGFDAGPWKPAVQCYYCHACEVFIPRPWAAHCPRCGRTTNRFCLPAKGIDDLSVLCDSCQCVIPRRAPHCPHCGSEATTSRRTWAFAYRVRESSAWPRPGFWEISDSVGTPRFILPSGSWVVLGFAAGFVLFLLALMAWTH